MLLSYEIDEHDRRALARRIEKGMPSLEEEQRSIIGLAACLGVFLAWRAAFSELGRTDLLLGLVSLGALCLLVFVVLPSGRVRSVRRRLQSPVAELGHHTLHLSEAGLRWGAPSGMECLVPAASVRSVDDELSHVFLGVGPGILFVIPKRALEPHGGEGAFLEAVERLWGVRLSIV